MFLLKPSEAQISANIISMIHGLKGKREMTYINKQNLDKLKRANINNFARLPPYNGLCRHMQCTLKWLIQYLKIQHEFTQSTNHKSLIQNIIAAYKSNLEDC